MARAREEREAAEAQQRGKGAAACKGKPAVAARSSSMLLPLQRRLSEYDQGGLPSDQMQILRSNGSVDAEDRGSGRARVGCHPLNDRDCRVIGRIADTSGIKDAAAGLLRGVQVGQRHRNLVVDGGLARLRILILCCGQSQRRGTGRKIVVDQIVDKLSDKASACSLNLRSGWIRPLGLRQQALPIGNPARRLSIEANLSLVFVIEFLFNGSHPPTLPRCYFGPCSLPGRSTCARLMAGTRLPLHQSINRLTSPHDSLLSKCRRSRHTEFQPHHGRHLKGLLRGKHQSMVHVGAFNQGKSSVGTQDTTNEHPVSLDGAAFEKILTGLPLATYRAGETIMTGGSKTGRLLILKRGAVVILKDSIEIARVEEPGAVLGEISALLDQPHTADVRAVEDSQFHVADAAPLEKDPIAVLHVARILARRLVATDWGLVELKKQIQAGQSPSALSKMLEKIEEVLRVGGASFET